MTYLKISNIKKERGVGKPRGALHLGVIVGTVAAEFQAR
jgi:hypothetical protein